MYFFTKCFTSTRLFYLSTKVNRLNLRIVWSSM